MFEIQKMVLHYLTTHLLLVYGAMVNAELLMTKLVSKGVERAKKCRTQGPRLGVEVRQHKNSY
jgi:hypothetical protein